MGKVIGTEEILSFNHDVINDPTFGRLFDRSKVQFKAEVKYNDTVGYTKSPSLKVGYVLGTNKTGEVVITRKLYHEGIPFTSAKRIPINNNTLYRKLDLSTQRKK